MKTRTQQLRNQLEAYVANAPADKKVLHMQRAQNWFYALNAFTNLPTLAPSDKISDLDPNETEWLNQLQGHINTLDVADDGKTNSKTKSQQFVHALPLVKNQFVVQPINPVYFFVGKDTVWQITVKGSFPLLLQDSSEIYLSTTTHKVPYTAATDSSITFQASPAQLGLSDAAAFDVKNIQLHLVGQVGKKTNKKKQFVAVYDLYAMALPQSAGKLTVTKTSSAQNTEKQSKRTRTFLLNGSKGNLVEKQCVPNPDGWALIPESVELVVESSSGTAKRDWSYHKTIKDGKTCFTTEVFFNSAGPSGKLEYHIKYDIRRNTTEALTETSEIGLTWNDVQHFNFDTPISKVVYTDPWGTDSVITDTSYLSPWLQLEMQNKNSIAIKTPPLVP